MSGEIIAKAIQEAGGPCAVARACGVKYQSVQKWPIKGMPRSEWTGETNHCENLQKLVLKVAKVSYKKSELMWRP